MVKILTGSATRCSHWITPGLDMCGQSMGGLPGMAGLVEHASQSSGVEPGNTLGLYHAHLRPNGPPGRQRGCNANTP